MTKISASLCLLPFLMPAAFAVAQEQTSTLLKKAQAEQFNRSVSFVAQVPNLEFQVRNKETNKQVKFSPNQGLNIGAEGNYDGYTAAIMLPIPPDQDSISKRGRTDHLDLMFSRYWDSFGGDVYYQRYSGFYVKEGTDEKFDEKESYPTRPDVNSHLVGMNFYYTFRPERFPLKSLTSFEDMEEGRGGSVVLFSSLNEFRMGGETPLIRTNSLLSARFRTLIVGGGYGYRWMKNNNQLSGQMLYGIGPQDQQLNRVSGSESRTRLDHQVILNFGYAYRKDNWMFGMNLLVNQVQADVGENERMEADGMNIKMFASLAM